MKQTFTFHSSVIASTVNPINVEAFDRSIEAFENQKYKESLHLLLEAVRKDSAYEYANSQGNEYRIPHDPILVHLQQKDGKLFVTAPFMTLPEEGQIAVMRRVANLNFDELDLVKLTLRPEGFYFEYYCPLTLSHPRKIQHVLEEICHTAAKHSYEFENTFNAKRIEGPQQLSYSSDSIDHIYMAFQQSCQECLDALHYFESSRNFKDMWNVITTTLLKMMYIANPQGPLQNTLQKAIRDMDRDIPLGIVIANGKETIKKIQSKTKADLAKSLYSVETFISEKQHSNLQNIRENCESCYKQASAAMESGDYRNVCLRITHKFYEIFYHNHVQDDLNRLLTEALRQSSGQTWDKAAPILYGTLEQIIRGPMRSSHHPLAA